MREKAELDSYSNPGESRIRLMVTPPDLKAISSMTGARSTLENTEMMVKKLHQCSHENMRYMRRLLKLAGKYNEEAEAAIRDVYYSCELHFRSGLLLPSRKMSIKHIDRDFNQPFFRRLLFLPSRATC